MGYVIAIVVFVVIAVAGWALWRRSRKPAAAPPEPLRPKLTIADATPMTGLESALDRATDRSGRTIRDKIEGETIDALIIPDDTGPVLRRALDHVEHAPPPEAAPER